MIVIAKSLDYEGFADASGKPIPDSLAYRIAFNACKELVGKYPVT